MIVCVGPTPAVQRVMTFRNLEIDRVNRALETREGPAGKAVNVAKVLRNLGEQPLVCGFFGGERGRSILQNLKEQEIAADPIPVRPQTRLCVTAINLDTLEQTELVEESQPVSEQDYENLFAVVDQHIKSVRALVVAGTLTPGAPASFYARCVAAAAKAGCFSVVDAQRSALLECLQSKPSLVKPNRRELSETIACDLADSNKLRDAMRELVRRGAERVVITSGPDLVVAFDGKRFFEITPPSISALNSIGSGDAFTAALTWKLLAGDDLGTACAWGAAAGAANALTLMPGDLQKPEVDRLFIGTKVRNLIES